MDTLFDPIARASDLVPILKQRASEAEQLRQVPTDSVRDLIDSGLIRIGLPDRFGGYGLDIDTTFAVSMELGRGCGSTAWCYAIWSAHNWLLGYFPEQCQEEHFASGPNTLISSALNPANSTVERVPGGIRVSGRWTFSSGCDAASSALVGVGATPEARRWVLLPRSDYEIIDTWFTAGLRGTGSKDIIARDVFVPEYRTINPNLAGDSDLTGWKLHQRTSYRVPLRAVTNWSLTAAVIGMAQGAVDEFTSRSGKSGSGAASAAKQLRLAEASAEVDTARTLQQAAFQTILESSGDAVWFSPFKRARSERDGCFTAQLCLRAVNRLYDASGGRAISEAEPIQRQHRDVNAACHHAALNWDTAAEQFGRLALGVEK